MDLILDTCALLALVGLADHPLSDETLARVREADKVYLSSCSMFEIAIKHKRRGLDLGIFPHEAQLWDTAIAEYELTEWPVTHQAFRDAVHLPDHHADPFDRIIIAQARKLGIPIVTFDGIFSAYEVTVLC